MSFANDSFNEVDPLLSHYLEKLIGCHSLCMPEWVNKKDACKMLSCDEHKLIIFGVMGEIVLNNMKDGVLVDLLDKPLMIQTSSIYDYWVRMVESDPLIVNPKELFYLVDSNIHLDQKQSELEPNAYVNSKRACEMLSCKKDKLNGLISKGIIEAKNKGVKGRPFLVSVRTIFSYLEANKATKGFFLPHEIERHKSLIQIENWTKPVYEWVNSKKACELIGCQKTKLNYLIRSKEIEVLESGTKGKPLQVSVKSIENYLQSKKAEGGN